MREDCGGDVDDGLTDMAWLGLPLDGMPSLSSPALARAAVASCGREVRMSEAERGRGRAAASGSSSGIGGDRAGVGESGMMCGGDVVLKIGGIVRRVGVGKLCTTVRLERRITAGGMLRHDHSH